MQKKKIGVSGKNIMSPVKGNVPSCVELCLKTKNITASVLFNGGKE
tara:strand:- start:335 stop:472 length:138 start_codon:yes stop_codon:yes gene_type:complete